MRGPVSIRRACAVNFKYRNLWDTEDAKDIDRIFDRRGRSSPPARGRMAAVTIPLSGLKKVIGDFRSIAKSGGRAPSVVQMKSPGLCDGDLMRSW